MKLIKISILLLLCSFLLLNCNILATDNAMNEFRRSGGSLVCTTEVYKPNQEPLYLQCLRIGPLYIGQSQEDAERILGKPWKVIEQDGGVATKVFAIKSDETAKPYWVITFNSGVINAIQLTGKNPRNVYKFSSIKLGDKKVKVLEILGEPFTTKPVESVKGILWSYHPFPISLELVDEKVYSIRVSR